MSFSEKIQCSLSRQHVNIQWLSNWFLLHLIYDYGMAYLTENCGCTCNIIGYLYCKNKINTLSLYTWKVVVLKLQQYW
jgi:hypothetical protein